MDITCVFLVINVGLSESRYTNSEENGSVPICVLLDGLLQRPVSIQLFGIDGSATGIRIDPSVY